MTSLLFSQPGTIRAGSQGFRKKPEGRVRLNRQHWLAPYLIFFAPMTEPTDKVRDIINGDEVSLGAGVSWYNHPEFGWMLEWDGVTTTGTEMNFGRDLTVGREGGFFCHWSMANNAAWSGTASFLSVASSKILIDHASNFYRFGYGKSAGNFAGLNRFVHFHRGDNFSQCRGFVDGYFGAESGGGASVQGATGPVSLFPTPLTRLCRIGYIGIYTTTPVLTSSSYWDAEEYRLWDTLYDLVLPEARRVYSFPALKPEFLGTVRSYDVDLSNPVNKSDPLNRDLTNWWLHLPGGGKGNTLLDLCRRAPLTLSSDVVRSGSMGRAGGMGSVRFDGDNSYASGAITPLSRPLTVTGWVMQHTAASGGRNLVRHDSGANDGWAIVITNGFPDYLAFAWGGVEIYYFTTLSMSLNTWRFFACTVPNNGGTAVGYLSDANGTLMTQSSATGSMIGTPNQMHIGGLSWFSAAIDGSIDDVRIHNRVLSATEIRAIYQASRQGYLTQLNHNYSVAIDSATAPPTVLGGARFRSYDADLSSPVNWSDPLNRGLRHWWLSTERSGDKTLHDLCHRRDITLTGIDLSKSIAPAGNRSFSAMDASDVGITAQTVLAPPAKLTISAWVSALQADGRMVIDCDKGAITERTPSLYTTNWPDYRWAFSAWDTSGSVERVALSVNQISWDTPTHLIGVQEVGSVVKLYVNGVRQTDSAAVLGGLYTSWSAGPYWSIMRPYANQFYGSVDDLRVHYNWAASDSEALALYRASRAGYPTQLNRNYSVALAPIAQQPQQITRLRSILSGGALTSAGILTGGRL